MVKNLSTMWETQIQYLGQEDSLEKGITTHSRHFLGFPGGSVVKNLPAKQETWVRNIPGPGYHLEKEVATHSSILAWESP